MTGSLSIHRGPVGVPHAEDDGEVAEAEGGEQAAHVHRRGEGPGLLARRGGVAAHLRGLGQGPGLRAEPHEEAPAGRGRYTGARG